MENSPPFSHRRLQRNKDFTGDRISTFRDVFLRHGLPGFLLAVVFFTLPAMQVTFASSVERGLANPIVYSLIFILIIVALNAHAVFVNRDWNVAKLGWILYLGALSFWEEWVFRLAIPTGLESLGAHRWIAVILSSALFGAAHYFTLRWRWQWCVGAFVGSLFLSRQLHLQNDLLMITAIHWVATYLNTPRPPGQSSSAEIV